MKSRSIRTLRERSHEQAEVHEYLWVSMIELLNESADPNTMSKSSLLRRQRRIVNTSGVSDGPKKYQTCRVLEQWLNSCDRSAANATLMCTLARKGYLSLLQMA